MNILVIWRKIPNNWNVSINKIEYILKYLHDTGNEVTLVAFNSQLTNKDQINHIKKYSKLFLIDHPSKFHSCVSYIRYFKISLFPFSRIMTEVIKRIIKDTKIDLIYVDQVMLNHVLNLETEIPVVLDIVDPLYYTKYQFFKSEINLKRKSCLFLEYIYYKYFELPRYKNLDAFIFVSNMHKKLLSSYIPKDKMQFCVPQGVDTEKFTPQNKEVNCNCIIFTGSMNYPPNISAAVYFCNKIFPHLKNEIKNVKFFIVGANPSEEVLRLKSEDIIVTGFVDDTSLYFKKAAVVVVPIIIDDGGFKMKVLEAMAMGKAIVSTSLGAKGLNVTTEKNIIIQDNPEEFADVVINLLKNENLKLKIEENARELVVSQYSYEVMGNLLLKAFNTILQDTDS